MTASAPDAKRRLLPRWRTSDAAVASGELRTPASPLSPQLRCKDFEKLLLDWGDLPGVEVAAELVSTAVVLGRTAEVDAAAQLLAAEGTDVSPALRHLSQRVLSGDIGSTEVETAPTEFTVGIAALNANVVAAKRRVRSSPKNALAWMDLAHAHTVLGQVEKAKREVQVAMALAPENRFIVRSAARFFVHVDDLDAGLNVLRSSQGMRSDPWVIAAELSLSTVAHVSPLSYRRARVLADSDSLDPWHTAELFGALGTLQLADGVPKARKLFSKSLRNPTENAVAQAQWAATTHNISAVPTQENAYEAMALRFRSERRWTEALAACQQWSVMDPTSTRPLLVGGFMAEVALHDGPAALEFTQRWLVTAPNDFTALNNHAVALAYSGQVPEAALTFERISKRSISAREEIVRIATQGLIAFRKLDFDGGTSHYLNAFERASTMKDRVLQALVLWHLLREVARVQSEGVDSLVESLWHRSKDLPIPELATMREMILGTAKRTAALIKSADLRDSARSPFLGNGVFARLIETE